MKLVRCMKLCGHGILILNNMGTSATRSYTLTASLICANMLELGEEIKRLEKGGIESLHFDVMDALFVPRYGLHPEMLAEIRSITSLPIHVHAMVEDIEPYIETFVKAGATTIMPHVESHRHLHRALKKIRDAGANAGAALNLATPLNVLDYVLDDIQVVMLMAINPGIVGHKLIPRVLDKISDLKKKFAGRAIEIEIDGGVTPESAPEMVRRGATRLVCGSSTIFKQGENVAERIKDLQETIDANLK